PGNQCAQGIFVNAAVGLERGNEGSAASPKVHAVSIARTAENFTVGLELLPDFAEVVEALSDGDPLGGAHGALGEAAAILGIVAKIDVVIAGVEGQLVHADDLSFAKGDDLQLRVACLLHDFLKGERSAGWRIFLVGVVALEDLAEVAVFQRGSRGARNFKKQIYANRKIRAINKAGSGSRDQGADSGQFRVPASGAYDHVLAGSYAGLDVQESGFWRGEVNYDLNLAQVLRGERRGARIIACAQDADLMPAFPRKIGDQRARLSGSEKQ